MFTHAKEEKQAYFKSLRDRWTANKLSADQDQDARAKWQATQNESPDNKVSYYGFFYALQAMRAQNLPGVPYVDAKTFQGWKSSGFIVKKGQHSTIEGITWISGDKKEADEKFIYP